MREIVVAKTAGFCFGVKRAVDLAREAAECSENVYCVGSIVHNKYVNRELEEKGIRFVKSLEEVPDGADVIIRAHGVTQEEIKECEKKHLRLVDTTCPNVKKIHRIVEEYSKKGYRIVIVGDKNHPEVIGISGWSVSPCEIVYQEEELSEEQTFEKICIVSQTTMNLEKNQKIIDKIMKNAKDYIVFDTVCRATEERQNELRKLAQESDYAIIIGDPASANSNRLYEISKEYCNSQFIENIDELCLNFLGTSCKILVMAGASTPASLINDVVLHLKQDE
ncbi:MAG: 4-hydroxy-3-methylbut-2-enyl diphosphate reductase [Clostridia bacterium]|nr:4-hydroxy-3-methylbut-2-enyl diphosphate reductase [Clostridia bacterium]